MDFRYIDANMAETCRDPGVNMLMLTGSSSSSFALKEFFDLIAF